MIEEKSTVQNIALESMVELLKGKIESSDDPCAGPILKRLMKYVDMIQAADKSYYAMMNALVDLEVSEIKQHGYSFKENTDGTIDFDDNIVLPMAEIISAEATASAVDSRDTSSAGATEQTDKKSLTKNDYYHVLTSMQANIRENGIPKNIQPIYDTMKSVLDDLVNGEAYFGLAMSQARPYLSSIEGMFCVTQYYSNMQLLLSLKSMFESFK